MCACSMRVLSACAVVVSMSISGVAGAATIGAGTGITLEAVDTPGAQPRTNVDESFTVVLDPGVYVVRNWEYAAGQTGVVTPFVATSTGVDSYNVEALGNEVSVTSTGTASAYFGFSNTFVLAAPTTVYAGITNSSGQNPIYLDNNTIGTTTDHDGSPGPITAIGTAVNGFSNPNLPRTYAFSLNIDTRPTLRVGADVAIPHEAVDTPGGGPRMNIDLGHSMVLDAGLYRAQDFSFSSGQDGSAIPFLATFDGANYTIIALGKTVTVPDGNLNVTTWFGGSNKFELLAATEVFAGFTNPAGSDNPIYLDNVTGTLTDHDGSPATLTGIGQVLTKGSFSNQNLNRTYAFSIGLTVVPEPASMMVLLVGGAALTLRRRRPN